MYNLFLNKENDIFNYSEGELKEYNANFYIVKEGILVPKSIVTTIVQVESIPKDYEDGKYKYVNNAFVLNPLQEGEHNVESNEII